MNICVILSLLFIIVEGQWIPKIVWTYWEKPFANDQHYYKVFTQNHKRILKDSGWEYRFLNKLTVQPWIKDMKQVVQALQRPQFRDQHITRRANLIRLALVSYYGGVWIDYSTCLLQNFDWLYKLKQIPIVQNIYGDQPQVFMTYNSYHKPPIKAYDQETNSYFFIDVRLQTSFIAAQPNSTFLNKWLNFFIEGKRITQQKLKQNIPLVEDSWIVDTAIKQKVQRGSFLGWYFQFQISILIVLQRKQREFDRIWQSNGKQGYRKFAMKQYGIWVMSFQKSILFAASFQPPTKKPSPQSKINYLFKWDQDYLKQRDLLKIYPIKTVRPTRDEIIDFFNQAVLDISSCPYLTFINQDSLFYKYLLRDYPVKYVRNIYLNKYTARLNLGLFCPRVVHEQKRQIVIDYTQNGLGGEINRLFENVYGSYYVDIGDKQQSTLGLYTKRWSGINVEYFPQNKTYPFVKQNVNYLNFQVGQLTNSVGSSEKTITLKKLCQQYFDMKPTFLNIGEMGVKRMALHTNDWENLKCRPQVIQIKDIQNQANYLQHEMLLTNQDYVLLKHYKPSQQETVSHIFVTKQKVEYYRRHYRDAYYREDKEIGVIKFSVVKKIVQLYFHRNFSIKGKVPYHFTQAEKPLNISNLYKRKQYLKGSKAIFVFGFDPLGSQIIVNDQYNISVIEIDYLRFLKLDVRDKDNSFSVFILDSNLNHSNPLNETRIKKSQHKLLQIQAKSKQTESKHSKQNKIIKALMNTSLLQYGKLNDRVIILYCFVTFLCVFTMISLVSNIRARRLKKYQKQPKTSKQSQIDDLNEQQSSRAL